VTAPAVETIHIEHHRLSEQPGNPYEWAVGNVARQHHVVVAEGHMQ
jgi:hypothetical protein